MGGKNLVMILATLSLLMAATAPANAQKVRNPWMFEGYGGAVFPSGTFGEFTNIGGGGGLGVGYRMSRRVALFGTFGVTYFGGTEGRTNWVNYNYYGQVAFTVTRARAGLTAMIPIGVGGSTFKPDIDGASSETFFSVTSGLKFYYFFDEQVGLLANAMAIVALSDEESLGAPATWLFPITAGIVMRF